MTIRKLFKIFVALVIFFSIAIGLISINHPIVLKWVVGSARVVGRPINTKIYTDGHLNNEIKIFYIDKYWNGQPAKIYLLYFDNIAKDDFRILGLNKMENFVGIASSTNIRDYDIVAGLLFQSEVGSQLTPMQDDTKGLNFNPQLKFIDSQIIMTIPTTSKRIKYDSLRIVLKAI